jgi:hypothetical protein
MPLVPPMITAFCLGIGSFEFFLAAPEALTLCN